MLIQMLMTDERKDVKFPMWRKKVDGSLFQHSMTAVPGWVNVDLWKTKSLFSGINSKNHPLSKVNIILKNNGKLKKYNGWFTISESEYKGKPKISPRLSFEENLTMELQDIFSMSHARDLERRLRQGKKTHNDIEKEISFWEFLDIEWDSQTRTFIMKPHYIHPPQFPELFRYLKSKHILGELEQETKQKSRKQISKGDWLPRSKIKGENLSENVIYTLIDTDNKEIYVGEAKNLAKRFNSERHEIPGWDYYRIDKLPKEFNRTMRLTIERLMIRSLASLLPNSQQIKSKEISDYKIVNKKIDQ